MKKHSVFLLTVLFAGLILSSCGIKELHSTSLKLEISSATVKQLMSNRVIDEIFNYTLLAKVTGSDNSIIIQEKNFIPDQNNFANFDIPGIFDTSFEFENLSSKNTYQVGVYFYMVSLDGAFCQYYGTVNDVTVKPGKITPVEIEFKTCEQLPYRINLYSAQDMYDLPTDKQNDSIYLLEDYYGDYYFSSTPYYVWDISGELPGDITASDVKAYIVTPQGIKENLTLNLTDKSDNYYSFKAKYTFHETGTYKVRVSFTDPKTTIDFFADLKVRITKLNPNELITSGYLISRKQFLNGVGDKEFFKYATDATSAYFVDIDPSNNGTYDFAATDLCFNKDGDIIFIDADSSSISVFHKKTGEVVPNPQALNDPLTVDNTRYAPKAIYCDLLTNKLTIFGVFNNNNALLILDLNNEDSPFEKAIINPISYGTSSLNNNAAMPVRIAYSDKLNYIYFTYADGSDFKIECYNLANATNIQEDLYTLDISSLVKSESLAKQLNYANASSGCRINDILFQNNNLYVLAADTFDPITMPSSVKTDYGTTVMSYGVLFKFDSKLNFVSQLGMAKERNITVKAPFVYQYSNGYILDNLEDTDQKLSDEELSKHFRMADMKGLIKTPASATEKSFSYPVRFIAINPKKLIISDDGFAVYVDSNEYKYKNFNRYVTVDLQSFTMGQFVNIQNEFGSSLDELGIYTNDVTTESLYYNNFNQDTGYAQTNSGAEIIANYRFNEEN